MTGPPVVGLDVGGTYLKSIVWDGEIVDAGRERVPRKGVLPLVEGVARRLVDTTGAAAVGLGLAGLVTWPAGEFAWGPHVAGEAIPYRAELGRRLGLPVVVDNDANLAALAEARAGAGVGYDPVLMVTFGTGIGGGLVVDGEVYRGRSFAGEVGHMLVLPDGPPCACGGRGCWETLVSGSVLDDAASRIVADRPDGILAGIVGDELPSGARLAAAAMAGDVDASAVFREAGEWMGRGLRNLVVALDPGVVVVGGAMAAAGELLLAPAREMLDRSLPGRGHRPAVPLVAAAFDGWSGAVGAALAAARTMEGDT